MFEERMASLRARLKDSGIDIALITDEDSVYYFSGYYDYLHMDFGRPTVLAVPCDTESVLITPTMELEMAATAHVDKVEPWNDGLGEEWREALPGLLKGRPRIAVELQQMPPVVRTYVESLAAAGPLEDLAPLIAEMRMIKSAQELDLARHAGQVATAMMSAGRQAIGHDVHEFEVALATSNAGTREAARILQEHYPGTRMSPNTHFLQIMASGHEITMPHHRASTRVMKRGEPVFLCFCGMTNFHRFKLGFDRTFWIGEVGDKSQEAVYQVALDSQAEALKMLRPGVRAEELHAAYAEVIQTAGYDYPFRCGRATGFSFLEKPQLVFGDKTVLQPGMVLAVDGSVTQAEAFRAQVGDSFIVTEDGFEQLTHHPNELAKMIV
ncbi:MAG: aminopeptidase P family protein [Alphaproteobacteria bacterium]|nr:aminopeptidase P family protein [Alphaproteobacteria bacterium]